jgi:hypothetical protein
MFQIHMLLSISRASFLHSAYSIVHDVCAFPASAAASNDPGLSAASGRWGGGDAHLTSVSSGPVWVGCGWWTLVSLGSLGQRMDGRMDQEVWINSDEFSCTTYSFFFPILTGDMDIGMSFVYMLMNGFMICNSTFPAKSLRSCVVMLADSRVASLQQSVPEAIHPIAHHQHSSSISRHARWNIPSPFV